MLRKFVFFSDESATFEGEMTDDADNGMTGDILLPSHFPDIVTEDMQPDEPETVTEVEHQAEMSEDLDKQFISMDTNDVHDFIGKMQNNNTRLKTLRDTKLFGKFLSLKGETRQMHEIPPN